MEREADKHPTAEGGSVSADPHEMLGVVVGWHRRRWWKRASPRKVRLDPGIAPA